MAAFGKIGIVNTVAGTRNISIVDLVYLVVTELGMNIPFLNLICL